MKLIHNTREGWLEAATKLMATALFTPNGYKVPKTRVSCGWPSSGGMNEKNKTLGQCWSPMSSADGITQIFDSPYLTDDPKNTQGVLPTHAHELVHAVVGLEEGHNKIFKKCATAIGLTGKMTAIKASEQLMAAFGKMRKELGVYPHSKLDLKKSLRKKQSTRLIKMECGKCGYVARTSRKWLLEAGPCLCPTGHGKMQFDAKTLLKYDPDKDGSDDGDD